MPKTKDEIIDEENISPDSSDFSHQKKYKNIPLIAIVGRPNVGKSTLFNRFLRKRRSITDPTPGVTRDPVEAQAIINGLPVMLVDTGGFKLTRSGDKFEDTIDELVMEKTISTLKKADRILLLLDAGLATAEDEEFIQFLRPYFNKLVVAVNKTEGGRLMAEACNYYSYGFKSLTCISAEHGDNISELAEELTAGLDFSKVEELEEDDTIRITIVGKPNTGKSTLAKMIAGTITPTGGQIKVSGRVVPFLELGVAFNSELSGYDNTILNGVLLGMERKYIKEKIKEIFAFAEVENFIETPLKFYSSGMLMRLAFSIGMFANGDVYIFDEILAVGDANFQKKCFDSFKSLIERKKTIILITHDLETVSKYATRVLLLNGKNHKIVNDINIIKQMGKSTFDDIYINEGLL